MRDAPETPQQRGLTEDPGCAICEISGLAIVSRPTQVAHPAGEGVLPMYEFTTQLATLEPPPALQQLLRVVLSKL